MTVIGFNHNSFTTKDGTPVSGYFIYLTGKQNNVVGLYSERIFVSDRKIEDSKYTPSVGDEIIVRYNKYGKVDYLEKSNAVKTNS